MSLPANLTTHHFPAMLLNRTPIRHTVRARGFIAVGLVIAALITLPAASAQAQSSTETPTPSPTVLPTLDPAGLDFNTATLYKADNDIFEIQVPASWEKTTLMETPDLFISFLSYGNDPRNPSTMLQILIGSPQKVFKTATGGDGAAGLTPESALKQLVASQSTPAPGAPVVTFSDIKPTKLGKLDAFTLTATVPAYARQPFETRLQVWTLALPNGQVAEVAQISPSMMYDKAQPVVGKMIDSLVFNGQNMALPTPTDTP